MSSDLFAAIPGQASRERSEEISAGEIATNRELLRYRGYTVRKLERTVRIDNRSEGGTLYFENDQYGLLSLKRQKLLRFDGVNGGVGNSIEFGLFSFGTSSRQQLLVSQDVFRGGNQWIVSLGRHPRILYDGSMWSTGREVNDMSVVDLNEDGTYELLVPTCIFYGFESLSPAATPLPSIVFKYSTRSNRYLPANPEFAKHVLAGIEDRKRNIHPTGSPPDDMNHLGDVLGVMLDYVFAGRAREAWAFYDAAYQLPDKIKIKQAIRDELRHSPVYRFIYRKRIRQRTRNREFEGKARGEERS